MWKKQPLSPANAIEDVTDEKENEIDNNEKKKKRNKFSKYSTHNPIRSDPIRFFSSMWKRMNEQTIEIHLECEHWCNISYVYYFFFFCDFWLEN